MKRSAGKHSLFRKQCLKDLEELGGRSLTSFQEICDRNQLFYAKSPEHKRNSSKAASKLKRMPIEDYLRTLQQYNISPAQATLEEQKSSASTTPRSTNKKSKGSSSIQSGSSSDSSEESSDSDDSSTNSISNKVSQKPKTKLTTTKKPPIKKVTGPNKLPSLTKFQTTANERASDKSIEVPSMNASKSQPEEPPKHSEKTTVEEANKLPHHVAPKGPQYPMSSSRFSSPSSQPLTSDTTFSSPPRPPSLKTFSGPPKPPMMNFSSPARPQQINSMNFHQKSVDSEISAVSELVPAVSVLGLNDVHINGTHHDSLSIAFAIDSKLLGTQNDPYVIAVCDDFPESHHQLLNIQKVQNILHNTVVYDGYLCRFICLTPEIPLYKAVMVTEGEFAHRALWFMAPSDPFLLKLLSGFCNDLNCESAKVALNLTASAVKGSEREMHYYFIVFPPPVTIDNAIFSNDSTNVTFASFPKMGGNANGLHADTNFGAMYFRVGIRGSGRQYAD